MSVSVRNTFYRSNPVKTLQESIGRSRELAARGGGGVQERRPPDVSDSSHIPRDRVESGLDLARDRVAEGLAAEMRSAPRTQPRGR